MGGWQGIANMALTCAVLFVPTGTAAVCAAITYGDKPGTKFLGQASIFLFGLAASFGVLLALHAIWS